MREKQAWFWSKHKTNGLPKISKMIMQRALQEHLAAGAPTLTKILVTIFNQSINEGNFPKAWKEAVVTPVHKKGDKSLIDNNRPVSNLPAAAKLLELVICEQMSKYIKGLIVSPW